MPCRDGRDEPGYWQVERAEEKVRNLQDHCDFLARIACKALRALEEDGRADFLLLKDKEVREWWAAHKDFDKREGR